MQNRSVVRGVEILTLISASKDGYTLNEIVEKTEIPKTTAYEIILMLLDTGMIQAQEGKTRHYMVGLKAFLIGNKYVQNLDVIQEARPIVAQLSAQLDLTVFVAMLDGTQIIYLYKVEPDNVPISTARISNRDDVYCTSLGKAMLSAIPEPRLSEIIETIKFRARTKHTIMNPQDLRKDLQLTRKRGYALDDREILDFVMCLGAPVFDHKGHVTAGISTAGLYGENRNIEREGELVKAAALEISSRLGYSSHSRKNIKW